MGKYSVFLIGITCLIHSWIETYNTWGNLEPDILKFVALGTICIGIADLLDKRG